MYYGENSIRVAEVRTGLQCLRVPVRTMNFNRFNEMKSSAKQIYNNGVDWKKKKKAMVESRIRRGSIEFAEFKSIFMRGN